MSYERVSVLTHVTTVSEVQIETDISTSISVLGDDGQWYVTGGVSRVTRVFMTNVVIPSYMVSFKQHRIIVENADVPGAISTTLLFGLVIGGALVACVVISIVVWFIRNRRDDDIGYSSGSMDSDSFDTIGNLNGEVVREFANDLFSDSDSDVDDWLREM